MTTPQQPHTLEDWNAADFVNGWLERSVKSLPERQQRYLFLAALAGLAPDEAFTFLDVGAGGGWLIGALLDAYPNSRAVWLDMSAPMRTAAEQHLAPYGDRVSFITADLATGGWAEQVRPHAPRAAFSTIAIHNLFNADAIRGVYAELGRALQPGAVFVDQDYVAGEPAVQAHYQSAGAFRRGEAPGLNAGRGRLGRFAGALGDHLAWLRAAGFATVDCPARELNLATLIAVR